MKRVLWFKEIHKEDIPSVGGKGANLGEMFNIGLPVPEGFAISAQTYAEFVEKSGINQKIFKILSKTNVDDSSELQVNANEIQRVIYYGEMPSEIKEDILEAYSTMAVLHEKDAENLVGEPEEYPFVAVRSSATAEDLPTASFAGQQATFLNIRGKEEIIDAVKKCWASLFTARAIYYREKNHFPHDKVLISVIVQRMVNASKSGIMFSANPVTNNLNEIIIEAVYGLGETIVSGSVNPNTYIVDKKTLAPKSTEIRGQDYGLFRDDDGQNIKMKIDVSDQKIRVLDGEQVRELAVLARRIEEHYKKPQDMEFALEGEKIYIVQSRPITTLKQGAEKSMVSGAEVILKGFVASPGIATGTVKIIHEIEELEKIKKGDILVTKMTTPDMVPAMEKSAGIITDEGGITCHAAIVSREMQIPCIVGTGNATEVLHENEIVTINATHGEVYLGKVEMQEEKEEEITSVETKTSIKIVIDIPNFAEKAAATGADGVGLVRSEIIIATGGIHPSEYIRQGRVEDYIKLLEDGIGKIAEAFKGKPVWVRTSDMRTDEYRNLEGGEKEPHEDNPMMGWHAIRRVLDEPEILKAEFRAIKNLHEKGLKNVGIMLPFIIRAREVRAAKKIAEEVGLDLKNMDFGVMIETPASCWIIEEIAAEGISFVSFGTNDLTQLTLGIDRNNEKIAPLYDEMHPSVLREIEHVIKVCKKNKIKTSICGQAGSRPEMAAFLVKNGIDSISAAPDAVNKIRKIVAEVEKDIE